jgi:hypothetical protein
MAGLHFMDKLMKKILLSVLLLASFCANAAVISFGPTSAGGSGPLITFDNLVTPTSIIGDATITLNVKGDFDHSLEYADVSLDGFVLGRIFDNNTANDAFDFTNDVGNQSQSTVTGSAIIANSDFASLILDGLLNISFDTSDYVDCCGTVNILSGSITFNEVSAVPVPAALFMFAPALLGFFGLRRKLKA